MYAAPMDREEICSKFLDAVTYELYAYQEEALLAWFEAEGGVLVAAPTGMGKTLIAEAAVFEALHARQKLYYTTPLIALTDQKFREFQDKAESWGFSRDDVGLITGNRRVNPDAIVRIVVAEILLNHLLADDVSFDDVSGVVMDEFHYFNDYDRGAVWELSLILLPSTVRLLLLSATVGNAAEFARWAEEKHSRSLRVVQTDERRVPLEFNWVGDKLLTDQLLAMVSSDDAANRAPALVFCFNREECWEVAERLKGLKLVDDATKRTIQDALDSELFAQGIGPKLRQMLMRGVGVHHAGVLPKYKEVVESLFLRKLVPYVICTETLAAGINLPARSVVLNALLKGKRGEKKLLSGSAAHQMFGRAGRPQFDTNGYVFALAHEDDVKIAKWRKKYELIDPKSKDPGIMRVRKDLERKKPSRRKTVQYWTEGHLKTLIEASPANLYSRGMIPYGVLIYLLVNHETPQEIFDFIDKRFNSAERLAKFHLQLEHMIGNLEEFGWLKQSDDGETITLTDGITKLLKYRSIDPLFGSYLQKQLHRASFDEKLLALESALPISPTIKRKVDIPDHLEPGPLQQDVLTPQLLAMGLAITTEEGYLVTPTDEEADDGWDEPDQRRPLSLPEMLQTHFEALLKTPETINVQPQWILGGILEFDSDCHKFIRARDLAKNEGLILRHLLRLSILAGEFLEQSEGDPDYERIGERTTAICKLVDPRYTDRFLTSAEEAKSLTAT